MSGGLLVRDPRQWGLCRGWVCRNGQVGGEGQARWIGHFWKRVWVGLLGSHSCGWGDLTLSHVSGQLCGDGATAWGAVTM